MEKKGKGLFERLMDFWKEKIHTVGEDRIGFWYEGDFLEEHFAEMGAVAAMSQREMQKGFLQESVVEKQQMEGLFFSEKEEDREMYSDSIFAETAKVEERKAQTASVFAESVKMFREDEEELHRQRNARSFLWDRTVEEKEERKVLTIPAMGEKKAELLQEEAEKSEKMPMRTEIQKAAEIDVEKLMQQITKKLWEEREGCGRRLR